LNNEVDFCTLHLQGRGFGGVAGTGGVNKFLKKTNKIVDL
jgi:hypothetical protein